MAAPFQIGDTVELKSGSPEMSVESIDGDTVYCIWFDKTEAKRNHFPAATLKKPSPSKWNV